MKIPRFENRIYRHSSPQAKFLLSLCRDIGKPPLEFAARTYSKAYEQAMKSKPEFRDPRGFVLGLQSKGFDVLSGIRCLGANGLVGPAISLLRTLFESYVTLRYVTERNTTKRVELYREEQLRQISRMWRDMAAHGHREAARYLEDFESNLEDNPEAAGRLAKRVRHWSTKNLRQLAADVGLEEIYATLYRSASGYTHALDIDFTYNPFMLEVFEKHAETTEPHFMVNASCWSARDVLALVTFTEEVAWSHFGRTAGFLKVAVSAWEGSRIARANHAIENIKRSSSFEDALEQLGWTQEESG